MTDECVVKTSPLRRQTIDVRGLHKRMTITGERVRRLIIGEKKDDVGSIGRLHRNRCDRHQEKKKKWFHVREVRSRGITDLGQYPQRSGCSKQRSPFREAALSLYSFSFSFHIRHSPAPRDEGGSKSLPPSLSNHTIQFLPQKGTKNHNCSAPQTRTSPVRFHRTVFLRLFAATESTGRRLCYLRDLLFKKHHHQLATRATPSASSNGGKYECHFRPHSKLSGPA